VAHWSGRALAKALGISLRAVQRIWLANRLQPSASVPSGLSDPVLAAKAEDIVGLYMDLPCHPVVCRSTKGGAASPSESAHWSIKRQEQQS